MSDRRYIRPYKLFVGSFVPNWLMERTEVSAGAKLCYARLAQHEGAEGEARARQESLASELGVGERMVRNYTRELERHGLVEVVQLGLNQANRYRFLLHPWMGIEDEPAEGISGPDRKDRAGPEWKDASGQDRQDASGPTNEENQRRETGADAPDGPSETPSLFRAEGLPPGSPSSRGSPTPPAPQPPAPGAVAKRTDQQSG